MSRLGSLSANALKAMFNIEADDTLVTLVTITGAGIATPIRLADNYTKRLSETEADIIYGLTSQGQDFAFMPFKITLPTETAESASDCQILVYDLTQQIVPVLRQVNTALNVQIDLVLLSNPDAVEISFGDFILTSAPYNAESVTLNLSVDIGATEPFPSGTFTPSHFPGIF